MTEEEFIALLALDNKHLIIDRTMSRGNSRNAYKPVPYYSAAVCDKKTYMTTPFTKQYRSRTYAVKKLIKTYYADN